MLCDILILKKLWKKFIFNKQISLKKGSAYPRDKACPISFTSKRLLESIQIQILPFYPL